MFSFIFVNNFSPNAITLYNFKNIFLHRDLNNQAINFASKNELL